MASCVPWRVIALDLEVPKPPDVALAEGHLDARDACLVRLGAYNLERRKSDMWDQERARCQPRNNIRHREVRMNDPESQFGLKTPRWMCWGCNHEAL